MKDTQSDRGQLILAGAVSFALILIAIAVVFSTTLFTASVGSSGTVETVSDGTGTEQSVEHTTEGLIKRVNNQSQSSNFTQGEIESAFEEDLTTYSELLAESKTESGPTFVSVSVDEYGTVNESDSPAKLEWVRVRVDYETPTVRNNKSINVTGDSS